MSFQYEVEKRVDKNLKDRLPPETRLNRVFSDIADTYFLFPNPMLRVRHGKISFPESKYISSICMKKTFDGSKETLKEYETAVDDASCAGDIFNHVCGNPKLVVSGNRSEYKFGNTTINIDYVDQLNNHNWTEVEVIARAKDEIQKASEEVDNVFKLLGVGKDELTTETYAEMIHKHKT